MGGVFIGVTVLPELVGAQKTCPDKTRVYIRYFVIIKEINFYFLFFNLRLSPPP